MKKIILLIAFIIGIGVSASATPLILQSGFQILTIENVDYTITDRASDLSDTWVNPNGYTGSDYTGVYLGTITSIDGKSANDAVSDLENLIGHFFDDPSYVITNYGKEEYINGSWSSVEDPDELVSVNTINGGYSGTWTVTSPYLLDFYTVKGSTEFALYWVDPASSSGDWVTRHLLTPKDNDIPAISHFSASVSTPIPEPATMLLFGTGLVGLAGARARARRKKK